MVAYPQSSLTFDGAGNLYGTTYGGGLFGYGTVFELSPNGNGGWNETAIYSFTGGTDGANPTYCYMMFDGVGNLYGTAYGGGANGYGVVFELSPVGTSWTETVLYSFANTPDGANPVNGLIMDPAGNLYGKTFYGGAGDGIVFELSPSGAMWTEQAIYAAETEANDAGLTMDADGNIFGTTYSTVFELSPNGNGAWNPTVIHTFTGAPKDGWGAEGTPVLDQAGNIYGTTTSGGGENYGTVYELSPGKRGEWTEKILHTFTAKLVPGGGANGGSPWAGIVFDGAGNIYGTTFDGGYLDVWPGSTGTVFKLAPSDKGGYLEKVLWSFWPPNGEIPYSSLILDSAGKLYGTTSYGGPAWGPYVGDNVGYGVAFEGNPSAAVTTTTLTSLPNPSTYGQAVTFTAVVTSSAGAPPDGGTVYFVHYFHGQTTLGTGALSGGSASFTTSTLPRGTSGVKAAYGGDFYFLGSTSNEVMQVVEKAGK